MNLAIFELELIGSELQSLLQHVQLADCLCFGDRKLRVLHPRTIMTRRVQWSMRRSAAIVDRSHTHLASSVFQFLVQRLDMRVLLLTIEGKILLQLLVSSCRRTIDRGLLLITNCLLLELRSRLVGGDQHNVALIVDLVVGGLLRFRKQEAIHIALLDDFENLHNRANQ
jgi:hypothetical protein